MTSTGLGRARGTGDEHHSVRVQDRRHQFLPGARLETEPLEVEREVALVENTEHDLLAEQRRERGHAVVDDLVPDLQLDAAVLRRSAMFNCAMILKREMSAALSFGGGFITSCSAPSIR